MATAPSPPPAGVLQDDMSCTASPTPSDITDVQSVDLELSFGAMLPADGAVINR